MLFSYIAPVWIMGFMSGMTLLISGNTMNFWLTAEHIDKTAIGMFALISLPYAISFIWSPILDHIRLPFVGKVFGQRFAWILLLQLLLSVAVYKISSISPSENISNFAIYGLIIAFLSSTQDIALGALRAEIIPQKMQGELAGIYIFGYRIGMLIGSSGAIYASLYVSWQQIYIIFANMILYFPMLLYFSIYRFSTSDTDSHNDEKITHYLSLHFWKTALKTVGTKAVIITILVYLILYRLPDNFISIMINPFLVEIGFDALEISTVGKFLGITTAIIGGLLAGYVMRKIQIIDAMLYFGIIHAFSHLLFIVQNYYGHNIHSLFIVIGVESITGGMVMASYIAFITSLCKGKYSATQYSFFSSMMGISRSVFPSISGIISTDFGWNYFFLFITIITIPPLWLSVKVKKILSQSNN